MKWFLQGHRAGKEWTQIQDFGLQAKVFAFLHIAW